MARQSAPDDEVDSSPLPVFQLALLALTLVAAFLCYLVARPFIPAVAWALALTIAALPVQRRLERKVRPSLAAAGSVLMVGLVIVAPAFFLGQRMVKEATRAYGWLSKQLESGEWLATLQQQPRLAGLVQWLQESADLGAVIQSAGGMAAENAPAFLMGSAWAVAQTVLTLFFVFFFLRDRTQLLEGVRSVMPLSDREVSGLFARVHDTVLATVWANVATSAVQGALGGLIFWLLGLPAPLVWGFAMFVFSLVPTLGSFVVWAPAAVYLALTGSLWKAAILTGWGLGPVGMIDNVLYPVLVRTRLQLHTLTAFVAVVGGVLAFGAPGLVLGPVAVAVAQTLAPIWRRRTRRARAVSAAA
jgi:predicted PurR-regulated permease PerM